MNHSFDKAQPYLLTCFCSLIITLTGCQTGPIGIFRAFADEVANEPAPLIVVSSDRKITQTTEEGFRVEVSVELKNPNPIELPIKTIDYEINFENEVFRFQDQPRLTLAAHDTQAILLAAAFPARNRKQQDFKAAQIGFRAKISYEPPGEIRKLMTESGLPLPVIFAQVRPDDFQHEPQWLRHHQPSFPRGRNGYHY